MLEVRKYTKNEISAVLGGTSNRQGIRRKLQRYGVEFVAIGTGEDVVFDIKKINNPFKVFCVTEMGIFAGADFTKLRNLFFYTLGDDNFANLPFVEMERIMRKEDRDVSRQTISKWQAYLAKIDYYHIDKMNCTYYAINKTAINQKSYTVISKDLYSKGWALYWKLKKSEGTSYAYSQMCKLIGGHPCKRPKFEQNAFYVEQVNTLIDLVNDAFLD